MDNATLPQIGMNQAGPGTSTSSDQGWIGWLKGLLPRQNRASKGDSNAPQAKFNTVWLNREAGSGARPLHPTGPMTA